nr:hypothetical protein BdHM001_35820 [Bdellovibrio sp. HM001]
MLWKLLILLPLSVHALDVDCFTSGGATACSSASSARIVNSTVQGVPTSNIDVPAVSGEQVNILLLENSKKMKTNIFLNNQGEPLDVVLDLSAKWDKNAQSNGLSSAAEGASSIVTAGIIDNLTLNTAGYVGKNGKNASEICAAKILNGDYGQGLKDKFMTRCSDGTVGSPCPEYLIRTKCDDADMMDLNLDTTEHAGICPGGFSYLSTQDQIVNPIVTVTKLVPRELKLCQRPAHYRYAQLCELLQTELRFNTPVFHSVASLLSLYGKSSIASGSEWKEPAITNWLNSMQGVYEKPGTTIVGIYNTTNPGDLTNYWSTKNWAALSGKAFKVVVRGKDYAPVRLQILKMFSSSQQGATKREGWGPVFFDGSTASVGGTKTLTSCIPASYQVVSVPFLSPFARPEIYKMNECFSGVGYTLVPDSSDFELMLVSSMNGVPTLSIESADMKSSEYLNPSTYHPEHCSDTFSTQMCDPGYYTYDDSGVVDSRFGGHTLVLNKGTQTVLGKRFLPLGSDCFSNEEDRGPSPDTTPGNLVPMATNYVQTNQTCPAGDPANYVPAWEDKGNTAAHGLRDQFTGALGQQVDPLVSTVDTNCSGLNCSHVAISNSQSEVTKEVVNLERGELGSRGGTSQLLVYEIKNIPSLVYQNGDHGVNGDMDISAPSVLKNCSNIVNNGTKNLYVGFHKTFWKILDFIEPTYVQNENISPRTQQDAVKLFKRTDPAVRDIVRRQLCPTCRGGL